MPVISPSAETRLSLSGLPSRRYLLMIDSGASLEDSSQFSDQSDALLSASESLSDSVSITDQCSFVFTANGQPSDDLSITDSCSVAGSFVGQVNDSVTFTDIADGVIASDTSVADAIGFIVTVLASRHVPGEVSESVALADATSAVTIFRVASSDGPEFGDIAGVRLRGVAGSTDQASLTDSVLATRTAFADCVDLLAISDQTRRIITADGIEANDFFLAVSDAGGYIRTAGASGRISVASSEASLRSD